MATVDEKQSEQMVSDFDADREGYFIRHAVGEYLPPLAPKIMRRLRIRDGSSAELAYYRKTKSYYRAIKPLIDALDAADAFDASPEGQEILRAIEKECANQKPFKLGKNPFVEDTDEDDDLPF